MPMKPAAWNYKDRNAAGWLHMWDLTLQTVWGRTPWERAAPRNAPSRGVRPQHDLGNVDRRHGAPFLPLETYDFYLRGEHPRVTIARRLRAGDGVRDDELARAPHLLPYPAELCVSTGKEGLLVQESGSFPSPAAEGARNYASMVLIDGRKVVASSVDADKTSSGLLRYTTVAPEWRGRGFATTLWLLTHECGVPAWRVSNEWFEMESQNNRIHIGMMRPLLKAHALCIARAAVRGVEVAADVMASAQNWESYSEELMAKAEASKAAGRQAGAFPGWQPPTAEQKEASAARKKTRAESKAKSATPRRTRRAGPRAVRSGRGVGVDAAVAISEDLQAATAEAREVLEHWPDLHDDVAAVGVAVTEAREILADVRTTTDALHDQAADAREVTEELAALIESLPAEAADMFRAMRDNADSPSETIIDIPPSGDKK